MAVMGSTDYYEHILRAEKSLEVSNDAIIAIAQTLNLYYEFLQGVSSLNLKKECYLSLEDVADKEAQHHLTRVDICFPRGDTKEPVCIKFEIVDNLNEVNYARY